MDAQVEEIMILIKETDAGQFEEVVRGMAEVAGNANEHNLEDPDLAWVQAANKLHEAAEWVRKRHGN